MIPGLRRESEPQDDRPEWSGDQTGGPNMASRRMIITISTAVADGAGKAIPDARPEIAQAIREVCDSDERVTKVRIQAVVSQQTSDL